MSRDRVRATATHVGTATVLLELGELRLLTDPALDSAGSPQSFDVPGTDVELPLRRTRDPVLPRGGLPHLDAVLLTHDEHADNFDAAGRAVAAAAEVVVTTLSGAARLGGNAIGLAPWESVELHQGSTRARVTATPAQHGPPAAAALVGDVIGFVVEVQGLPRAIYVSGDTVVHDDLGEIGRRFAIGPALLHLGQARFEPTGDITYSMSGADAAGLARTLRATGVLPVHYDDWAHFSESSKVVRQALAATPCAVHWMEPGRPLDLWRAGLQHGGGSQP
jgi:L-ascorbate metabolism protein UlaG (beta-lactamase superfamily)